MVAEWCQTCEEFKEVEVDITGLMEEEKKMEGVQEKVEMEEKGQEQLLLARGEVTPPGSPMQGSKKHKSPGTQAKQLTRLIQFQQQLSEKYGLPTTHLQARGGSEQETTPSPSPPSSTWLRGP